MEYITLMGHHLHELKSLVDPSKQSWFARWLSEKIYGKQYCEKLSKWVKSLDPDNTIVHVVEDTCGSDQVELDDMCEQEICPFSIDCSKGLVRAYSRLRKEKPLIFTILLLYQKLKKDSESDFRADKQYPLSHILRSI